MREVSLAVFMDVLFHLNPRLGLRSDALAISADGQDTVKNFDFI